MFFLVFFPQHVVWIPADVHLNIGRFGRNLYTCGTRFTPSGSTALGRIHMYAFLASTGIVSHSLWLKRHLVLQKQLLGVLILSADVACSRNLRTVQLFHGVTEEATNQIAWPRQIFTNCPLCVETSRKSIENSRCKTLHHRNYNARENSDKNI